MCLAIAFAPKTTPRLVERTGSLPVGESFFAADLAAAADASTENLKPATSPARSARMESLSVLTEPAGPFSVYSVFDMISSWALETIAC